ncbi:BadF/BadG/BcrA/BcrD ATPase family protein [Cohnella sp. WQ 127256]|uniref:N-acetylglucosamine kinase n=1 Tax=Cohnella sp. WQ 127256 TaxID=2938790 RepID=UPI0021191F33
MGNYVIGVDCGNSKTHYVLSDLHGRPLQFIQGGTSSHECFPDGYEGTRRELTLQIQSLLSQAGLTFDDIAFAIFGMAGIDIEEQKTSIERIISDIGIQRFKACNDGFLGIKAGSVNGFGICSINGAGTICAAMDPEGNELQVGGVGSVFGDVAGGAQLGADVIRAVYEQHYRMGNETALTGLLFEKLGIDKPSALVSAVYAQVNKGPIRMDSLSRLAFIAAEAGDETALSLLRANGNSAARSVAGALRNLRFPVDEPVDIILAGSLYIKGRHSEMLNAFTTYVDGHADGRTVRYMLLQEPPVMGAILWALELAGAKLTVDEKADLGRQLKSLVS